MKLINLAFKELWYRRLTSVIILFVTLVASSVSIAVFTLSKASEDETRKIMREQGLNLYIFPKGTNLIDFYSVNNTGTFPDTYVDVLAESKTFDAVRHLTGMLQIKYPEWKDSNGSVHQIVLYGYKDEAQQKYLPAQEIMGFDVKKGTVQIGAIVAKNMKPGAPFLITGTDGKEYSFSVEKILDEGKGMMDQGVSFYLEDLQQILGMPGQINKIEALGCVCKDGRIKNARNQVQAIFPDLEVTEMSSIADARENQRLMMNKYGAFIIPFIIITSLLVSGLLFYQNVNLRQHEIGLLKALGNSPVEIMFMIIFKAFIIGLAGGFIGFFSGTWIAGYFGKEIFRFTASNIKPAWSLFYYAISLFPLLLMIGSWIPALLATRIDAARTLSRE